MSVLAAWRIYWWSSPRLCFDATLGLVVRQLIVIPLLNVCEKCIRQAGPPKDPALTVLQFFIGTGFSSRTKSGGATCVTGHGDD